MSEENKQKPFIVHFEFPTECPKCRHKWTGMYRLPDGTYICIDCFKDESDDN